MRKKNQRHFIPSLLLNKNKERWRNILLAAPNYALSTAVGTKGLEQLVL
jgi:hypothetical protein